MNKRPHSTRTPAPALRKRTILRNRSVFTALFAALIAVSSFLIVPLPGGIPIVLKNLFVVLAGTVLGSFYGGAAVLIFLAAGIAGLPVFVIPGPGAFLTPLGGYLAGYFAGSLVAGLISGLPSVNEKKAGLGLWIRVGIASCAGFSIILICGAVYLMILNSMPLKAALLSGIVPLIPGDLIKLLISIPLAVKLRPVAARYINPDTDGTVAPYA
jgi:biotin transport system substrate-specific component